MMRDVQQRCRTQCGFAALADVNTARLDDRMDSFFLAETTKYLFLLFDGAFVRAARREARAAAAAANEAAGAEANADVDGEADADTDASGDGAPDPEAIETAALRDGCASAAEAAVYAAWRSPSASRQRSAEEHAQRRNWEARRRALLKKRCMAHRPLRAEAGDVLYTTEGHPILLTHPAVVRAFSTQRSAPRSSSEAAGSGGRTAATAVCARPLPRARLHEALHCATASTDPPAVMPRSPAPSLPLALERAARAAGAVGAAGQSIALVCYATGECTPAEAERPSGIRIGASLGAARGEELDAIAAAFGGAMEATTRGELRSAAPIVACQSQLTNADDLRGRVALIERGVCSFATKAAAAQRAGAIGALVISDGEAFTMAGAGEIGEVSGGELDITLPLAMVSKATGDRLLALLRAGAGRPAGDGEPSAAPRLAVHITLPTREVADEIVKAGKARAAMQRAFEAQPEMHAHIVEMIEKMSGAAQTEEGSFAERQFIVSFAATSSP